MILTACLIAMLCVATISNAQSAGVGGRGSGAGVKPEAQTNQAVVIETLPRGEYIVQINGNEFRAITPNHARELLAVKVEAKALAETNRVLALKISHLEQSLALAQKDVSLADLQRTVERERADKFQALYDGERGLRLQAESLRGGRTSALFNNPYVQFGVKIGLPILGMVISGRR